MGRREFVVILEFYASDVICVLAGHDEQHVPRNLFDQANIIQYVSWIILAEEFYGKIEINIIVLSYLFATSELSL